MKHDSEMVYQEWLVKEAEMQELKSQARELRKKISDLTHEMGKLSNYYHVATGRTETITQRIIKEGK